MKVARGAGDAWRYAATLNKVKVMTKKMLLFVTMVLVLLSSIACEHKTEAKLEGGNPPVFSVWAGTGELWFVSIGEYRLDKSLKPSERSLELWRIEPAMDSSGRRSGKYTWELGTITYGVVPEGYAQRVPSHGIPPALVSGKFYTYSFKTNSGMPADGEFEIRDNKAVPIKLNVGCYEVEDDGTEIEVPCYRPDDGQ